ncbi:MAG: sugar transporter, partial [Halomonadaceae bacterium]
MNAVTPFSQRRLYPLIGALLALLCSTPVLALDISDEQLRQFQNLPRAQQQALAQQQGVDLDELTSRAERQQDQRPEDIQVVETDSSASARDTDRASGELRPFGYDLFSGRPSTFAPVTEIPIPSAYIIGPGDVIQVQLYGNRNDRLELPVTRDGTVQLPESGPVAVTGMAFEEVREQLSRQLRNTYMGTEVSISIGALRSMRVFILGEAKNPGSYTVSSLSTMTNALLVSGGIETSGSLRNVQLKRDGNVVATLDLYDLLLSGDTSNDQRLQPGDTLFIPPVGPTVAVDGEVRRPAIYELRTESTLADMITMAGGYTRDAAPAHSQLERVADRRSRGLESIDLTASEHHNRTVREGDTLTVQSLNAITDGFVELRGEARRPGKREWRDGMTLSDILSERRQDLTERADLNYGLVVRERNPEGELEILQFSPAHLFQHPGGDQDLALQERDQILLFSSHGADEPRRDLLEELLTQLDLQASPEQPVPAVTIGGAVRHPGRYPIARNTSAQDLITAAGGLRDSALMLEAEIVRSAVNDRGEATTELLSFTLFPGPDNPARDITLQSYDRLLIKSVPGFAQRETVTLEGEVRFPGEYSIRLGDTLEDLLERAGGLTERAFPEGAVFSRERLRRLEQERMNMAEQRLRRDLLGMQLGAGDDASPQDLAMLQNLLQ